jgi:hypothetical protein
MKRMFFLSLCSLLFACSKSSYHHELETPVDVAMNMKGGKPGSEPPTPTGYNLSSFSVSKKPNEKWGSCQLAVLDISWTATGETYILGYELEKSSVSNFSTVWSLGTFPSSNNDASITRSYTDKMSTNGAQLTYYYRLKITHTDNTITYGPIASATVKTNICVWQ